MLKIYISKGLCAVILLSNCLSEPAAAFLAFANLSSSSAILASFSSSNSFFPIKISPRTIIFIGSFSLCGILLTVFKLSVTSSPTRPFPLVAPCTKIPFLYSSAVDNPSIFVSTTYSNGKLYSSANFCILVSNSLTSSKEKTSCKL